MYSCLFTTIKRMQLFLFILNGSLVLALRYLPEFSSYISDLSLFGIYIFYFTFNGIFILFMEINNLLDIKIIVECSENGRCEHVKHCFLPWIFTGFIEFIKYYQKLYKRPIVNSKFYHSKFSVAR